MKLGKPPVVEAWIKFEFGLDEDSAPWGEETASAFIDEALEGRYKLEVFMGKAEVALGRGDDRHPRIEGGKITLDRAKAVHAEDKAKVVQISRGKLVCNLLRGSAEWLGFEVLLTEALDVLPRYESFFSTRGVESVSVHYRDLVSIEIAEDENRLDLRDYFTLLPEVPDHYGPVPDFRMSCVLPEAVESGVLSMSLRRDRDLSQEAETASSTRSLRFAMDWDLRTEEQDMEDMEKVETWLQSASKDIRHAFRCAFTDQAWELFEPEEELSQ